MNMEGKTIVITGGTSGIGSELVEILVKKCKKVLIIARNKHVMDSLSVKHSNVTCYVCNLEKRSELESVIDSIIKDYPEVSIVINNAGIQNVPMFTDDDFNFDGIEREIEVNLMSPIWIVGLFLGHFIESKKEAAFVNVTTGLAFFPKTRSAVYCATKAGLRSFTKSLRYQLEGKNVAVFEAIMPIVETPMTSGRKGKKLSAYKAAKALVDGFEADKYETYIGISRLIPILSRISPGLMAKILKRG